jgi:hypothetical protein
MQPAIRVPDVDLPTEVCDARPGGQVGVTVELHVLVRVSTAFCDQNTALLL